MHWEPRVRRYGGPTVGYELLGHDGRWAVGVYGPTAWLEHPPADGEWHIWKNGKVVSEAMTQDEAKALAEVLVRMGEV